MAEERARKGQDLLKATEKELAKIAAATQRAKRPLRGESAIGLRVGRALGRFKMSKHFRIRIEATGFHYERDQKRIDEESALDGIYVIRTSVSSEKLSSSDTVRCYKRLSGVERAFRSLKTVDLKIRPIHHRLEKRVRAHALLCGRQPVRGQHPDRGGELPATRPQRAGVLDRLHAGGVGQGAAPVVAAPSQLLTAQSWP